LIFCSSSSMSTDGPSTISNRRPGKHSASARLT
jgi:hypothetical protein